jgi:hypothetical protein
LTQRSDQGLVRLFDVLGRIEGRESRGEVDAGKLFGVVTGVGKTWDFVNLGSQAGSKMLPLQIRVASRKVRWKDVYPRMKTVQTNLKTMSFTCDGRKKTP